MSGKLDATQKTLRAAALPLAILILALGLRLHGLSAESFWIDEALSVRFSEKGVIEILRVNAADVHPPLYYMGLYAWRGVLGDSDARIRAYSIFWSLIGLSALYFLARDLAGRRAALVAMLLGAFNPQDIFFAQEARMYTQAAALCTLSAWCSWRWMSEPGTASRKWLWATAHGAFVWLALLTHYLTAVVIIAQGFFAAAFLIRTRRWLDLAGYAIVTGAVAVLFLPWLLYVRSLRDALYNPGLGWMPKPPITDYFSFLGREFFWGQVHTFHDRWWMATILLPLVLIIFAIWRRRGLSTRYAVWLLGTPVLLAIASEYLYHRLYYRPRFSVLVLPPFLILAGMAIDSLRWRTAQYLGAGFIVALMVVGLWNQNRTMQKADLRELARLQLNEAAPDKFVFFPWALQFTAEYYLKQPTFSASRQEIETGMRDGRLKHIWLFIERGYQCNSWPGELEYYNWLLALGRMRKVPFSDNVIFHVIDTDIAAENSNERNRFARRFGPNDVPGALEGFGDPKRFHGLEYDHEGLPYRFSQPKAWLNLARIDHGSTVVISAELPGAVLGPDYRPDLKVYAHSGVNSVDLFSRPAIVIPEHRSGPFEIVLPVPDGDEPFCVGWEMNGVNMGRIPGSPDRRVLGLRVNWIGLQKANDNTSGALTLERRP